MIIFQTILVIALDACSASGLFADETLLLKSFLVDVLDSFDVDQPIFLLKIALRYPNCTHIVHPHEVTNRLVCWVRRLRKVVVIGLIIFATARVNVLLFVLVVGALFGEFMKLRVCVLEQW